MEQRYVGDSIEADLADRMVFIGGPRQVGKTTLALSLLDGEQDESSPAYLNWDVLTDRENILAERLPSGQPRVIFDEIHKYARWRNLMKGLYDKNQSAISFIVPGSARLDYYRKGGDSLQGRYHYYRLHPFTVTEYGKAADPSLVEQLLRFGGFPEPFLRGRRASIAGGCGNTPQESSMRTSATWRMCGRCPRWNCCCPTCPRA